MSSSISKLRMFTFYFIVSFFVISSVRANQTEEIYEFVVYRTYEADGDIFFKVNTIEEPKVLQIKLMRPNAERTYLKELTEDEYNKIVVLFSKVRDLPNSDTFITEDGPVWEAVIVSKKTFIKSYKSPMLKTNVRGLKDFLDLGMFLWGLGMKEADLGDFY